MTPRSPKHAAATEAWRLLMHAAQSRWGLAASLVQQLGLTPGHLKVLLLLEPDEARPMGSIAQSFACDASTMTWLVDRLEERGLVERRALPRDRRVKAVALTKRGVEMKRTAQDHLFEPPPELLGLDRATLERMIVAFAGAEAPAPEPAPQMRPQMRKGRTGATTAAGSSRQRSG